MEFDIESDNKLNIHPTSTLLDDLTLTQSDHLRHHITSLSDFDFLLGIYINIPFYFFHSHTYDYYFLLTQFMSRMVLLRCYHFIT